GATVNATLVTGLDRPFGIAVSGGDLFVVSQEAQGRIGEYTTSGATVNASLVSGLAAPYDIAVSGNDLFVTCDNVSVSLFSNPPQENGTVGEFTTAGATVNPSLISGLSFPLGIAVSGGNLFVGSGGNGITINPFIGEYTTSGATVNAALIAGPNTST